MSTGTSLATATATATTSGTTQVATVLPLTTTFIPSPTCTQMQLTQLSSPGYQVWLNEPMPVPGTKFPKCYPTEFMADYTSIEGSSSSIAPMMSPLVAPVGWTTVKELDNGYIALCPSGFGLANPTKTVDSNRPAYGGTCYSNFVPGVSYTVSGFDTSSFTGTNILTFTSGDQAYAHVIEGHKATTTPASSSSSSVAATASSNSISGGAIAGAVVGSVAGVALIFLAIFFMFRRRRSEKAQSNAKDLAASTYPTDGESGAFQATTNAEKDLPSVPGSETVVTSPSTVYSPLSASTGPVELPEHQEVYEMESPGRADRHVPEMDGGWKGTELGDSSHRHRHRG